MNQMDKSGFNNMSLYKAFKAYQEKEHEVERHFEEKLENILTGDMSPEYYHALANSSFGFELKSQIITRFAEEYCDDEHAFFAETFIKKLHEEHKNE